MRNTKKPLKTGHMENHKKLFLTLRDKEPIMMTGNFGITRSKKTIPLNGGKYYT